MKKLTVFALVALLLVSVFAFAGCKPEESGDVLKVGIVCIGSKDDKGYTYAHARGMEYAEACFNGKVKIYYRDNVDDGDPAATTAAIESLINDDGCTLIFTNSFGFMEPTAQAAEKYPNVKFMHCSGYKSNDTNFGNYFGRAYQARYLAGIAAGKATVTNKIGYVAAKQLTECYRGINAFTLGVKSVNPNATVYVKWTDTWYNPVVERSAALALLDGGCDVIAQHQDTTEPGNAAKEKGAFSCGYNSPMKDANPENYLTGPVFNWGYFYRDQIQQVLDGTWKVSTGWYGYEHKFDTAGNTVYAGGTGYVIGLDEYGDKVTQETRDLIAKVQKDMIDGKFDVFAGPIKDNKGNIKVADGAKMTDADMLSVDFTWLVEGATDEAIQ